MGKFLSKEKRLTQELSQPSAASIRGVPAGSGKFSSKHETAAITIQGFFRGYSSRKKTNRVGYSQGKEIEIYLPLRLINSDGEEGHIFRGGVFCSSPLFVLSVDRMTFFGKLDEQLILEISTVPFQAATEGEFSNLKKEEEIDAAILPLLKLLENFSKEACKKTEVSYMDIRKLVEEYNRNYPSNPMSISRFFKKKLDKKSRLEFCFDPRSYPCFDKKNTPRTHAAGGLMSDPVVGYQSGNLVLHIQKTMSLLPEYYNPEFLSIEKNPFLNNTPQQLEILKEAYSKAEGFLTMNPLPDGNVNRERIKGLLTICIEIALAVVYAKKYVGLHEKTDRPILSIRHMLHYVKLMICTKDEIKWFEGLHKQYFNERGRYQMVEHMLVVPRLFLHLGVWRYMADYRGFNDDRFLGANCSSKNCYDVIFDLFGDSKDIEACSDFMVAKSQYDFSLESWAEMSSNRLIITCRSEYRLQKVGDHKFAPLFEARRIGCMTVSEFAEGRSRVYFHTSNSQGKNEGRSLFSPGAL